MSDTVQRAAEALLAVRNGAPPLAGLGANAPADEAGAWAIQREVLRRLGGIIGGYKCATPASAPPSAALLDARGIKGSPVTWPVPKGGKIGIETEIAFRLSRDLPQRGTPYTQEEVSEAIAACFPAVELVVSRYSDIKAVPLLENMADNIAHAGLVCGAEVPGWRSHDLGNLLVRQSCGGQVQVEKRGSNPAGDPLVSLTRLANHLHGFGLHLQAGQVVTTGSWTGLLWVDGGQRVVGGFEGLGEVVVELG
ncbi:2-keto-4-pentenoate hydratase [Roseomonas sp. AR75]|uniref:2-keto-4-pentenoate hydratase n=1 Tax=Roseomonas sp. AR75 TaxID=2562311 RepID=UPI0010BFB217|nr:fumarylacetoacetate hydrolase family protein [Roseomonas sp. AR75]